MIHTSDLVEKVLPEAVDQVSDGSRMIYSMRNLFYAVRQLFLTRFMVCPACEGPVRLHEPPDPFRCEKCDQQAAGEDLTPMYPGIGFYTAYDSFTIKRDLEDLRRRLADELADAAEEEIGLDQVRDALYCFREPLEEAASSAVEDHMEDLEIPTVDLKEFKEKLEERMASYWTRIADALASGQARDLEEPVKSRVREEKSEIAQASLEDPDVKEAERSLTEEIQGYLRRRSL